MSNITNLTLNATTYLNDVLVNHDHGTVVTASDSGVCHIFTFDDIEKMYLAIQEHKYAEQVEEI